MVTTTSTAQRPQTSPQRLARWAIAADAAASAVIGVLLVAAAGGLDSMLGITYAVLVGIGVVLVAWAVELTMLLRRPSIPLPALRAIVAFNATWLVGSIAALAIGWDGRTGLGAAFVAVQAVGVVGFLAGQGTALRAATRVAALS